MPADDGTQMEKWRGDQNIRPGMNGRNSRLAQDPRAGGVSGNAPFNRDGRRRLTRP